MALLRLARDELESLSESGPNPRKVRNDLAFTLTYMGAALFRSEFFLSMTLTIG